MAYLSTLAEKKAKVCELQQVYDRAIAGETEIRIDDSSTGSVYYKNPDPAALLRRIQALQAEIAREEGNSSSAALRRAVPIGFS